MGASDTSLSEPRTLVARRRVAWGSRVVLLGGPGVLAFWSGGYFDRPRAIAGVIVWALVAIALADGKPLPRTRSGLLTLAALGLFAAWTLASLLWAPVRGDAYHAGQIAFLYLGAMLAGALLLRGRTALRSAEPALAAGAAVVVGYGLSERLVPGLLHFQHSATALGRLEQPLTYWNAMGELAALGLVLVVRLAGDETRVRWIRASSAATVPALATGLYLSFSRGALFASAAGLLTLLMLAPRTEQWRAFGRALAVGLPAVALSAPFRGLTKLGGPLWTRELQGAIVLAGLLALTGMAAGWALKAQAAAPSERASVRLPRHAGWLTLGLICGGLAVALTAGAKERSSRPLSPGATRYVTLQSNRYAYWRIALRAFRAEPVRGVGAAGWAVWWRRYRPFDEFATDAHSLPLQTMAELGIIGVVLLAAFLTGVGWAALDAMRLAGPLAVGPVAGFVTWTAHAPLDWDWQMPAVSLIAMILAGGLLGLADLGRRRRASTRGPARTADRPVAVPEYTQTAR